MKRDELLVYAGGALGEPNRKGRERFLNQIGSFVRFAQSKGLTRRVLLKENQRATLSTNVLRSDLTDEGYKFFKVAYPKWSKAVDEGTVEPGDVDLLAKALARIRRAAAHGEPASRETHQARQTQRREQRHQGKRTSKGSVRAGASDFSVAPKRAAEREATGPHVYDKADWHVEGEFPNDVSEDQANVHTGMFIGWLIDHDMVAEEFRRLSEGFRQRKMTGPQVYRAWGGVLTSEMLSEEGNQFAREYYEGRFADDFRELLVDDLPSFYHVPDTWENYEIMKGRIDRRFRQWRRKRGRRGRRRGWA